MSDEREPDIEIEDEKDEEGEFVILEEGETPPRDEEDEGTRALKEQIRELQEKADSTSALKESFVELGDVLKKSVGRQEQQQPQQMVGESDEDFWKRLEKDVWSDKTASVIKEAIRREAGLLIGQSSGVILKQAEKFMEIDPEKGAAYKRYKDEIHEFIKGLPPGAQSNPDVYEYAYGQVALRHIDEIAVMKADELLAKRGVIQKKPEPTYSETPGKVASGAAGKKTYVKKAWIEESERRGIPLRQIIRMRSGK